jgi:hypothetical protein
MNLEQVKYVARRLSLKQLRRLDEWFHELSRRAEASISKEASKGKLIVEERTLENKTYRLEGIRCGKEICKCARGKLHGPYWYSYTRVEGRVKSQYIGKTLPLEIEKALQQRRKKGTL